MEVFSGESFNVLKTRFKINPLSLDMKWLCIIFVALNMAQTSYPDSLKVMFWNLENFFDWRNDSTSVSDAEFSSIGAKHWTRKRFYAKCNAVAKGILWAGVPDVIGLAEIENAFVLRRLLDATALRKLDYRIVHFDSPDPRGIDVALLFRSSRLQLLTASPCHIYNKDSTVMATRDILMVLFRTAEGRDIAIFVNHHPSKYGGAAVSGPRRQRAVGRLKELADSLQNIGITQILAMGDMNDTPENPVYRQLEPTFRNLADSLYRKREGTIKFDGEWELIDLFFATPQTQTGHMNIIQIPFLMTQDVAHTGTKPLRTYSGPRYIGGVSDHCPIWITLILK